MTKEVLLTISGLQMIEDGQSEPVELVTAGDYYFRNGKHYILYDEVTEGSSQHTRNVVKIGKERLEVSKKGLTQDIWCSRRIKRICPPMSCPLEHSGRYSGKRCGDPGGR